MSQFILNLHGVGPVPRDLDDGEHDCWLDQGFFEAVLELAQEGPHVKLTFDDGNVSDWDSTVEAFKKVRNYLKKKKAGAFDVALYAVCSVQEEVGLRGAHTACLGKRLHTWTRFVM